MRYNLIGTPDRTLGAQAQVLVNRGITKEKISSYLNTTDRDISEPSLFGEGVLKEAAAAIVKAVKEEKKTLVVVDADCDGYTSAALLINYLNDIFPAFVNNNLKWYLHSGKQHGLSDCIDYALEFELVILPDASSNDYSYHQQLKENNTEIIILDHHEAEKISEYAIVVNNQLSDYPNKELSGVGVTWQFCRYFDSLTGKNFANQYLDLVALGLTADMMSMKSIETKHLINKGFLEESIKNPFIYGMADKNSYSLKGRVSPMGAAFYIAPFVNAMVRSGTQEEKELLFNAMLGFKAFDMIESTKRGHSFGELERVIDQALRVCTNVKNRQTRAQDAGMEFLRNLIEERNLLDHKVLLFLLEPGQIDRNIAGLIANKFMALYQRPCCILTKVVEENEGISKVSYQGSARGYDKSGVTNFKDICAAAPSTIYAEGHQGAFGLGIECGVLGDGSDEVYGEGLAQFIDYTDEILLNMASEPSYSVDFIFQMNEISAKDIIDIAELDDLWGKDMDEALVCVEHIKITKDILSLMSPDKKPTLKIALPNNISIIKFGSGQEEYESLLSENGYIEINAICKCNINEWNGNRFAQLFLIDFEVLDNNMAYYF